MKAGRAPVLLWVTGGPLRPREATLHRSKGEDAVLGWVP